MSTKYRRALKHHRNKIRSSRRNSSWEYPAVEDDSSQLSIVDRLAIFMLVTMIAALCWVIVLSMVDLFCIFGFGEHCIGIF